MQKKIASLMVTAALSAMLSANCTLRSGAATWAAVTTTPSGVTTKPVPVPVSEGDTVTGATVNGSGRLIVRAEEVGEGTRLAQITRLVHDAQTGKAPVQRLADQVSAVFVPIVLVLATLTLLTWLAFGGDPAQAFTAAIAVLIIACPCALGLATPVALLAGLARVVLT